MKTCIRCHSHAINHSLHGREEGVDLDLCDVCYWRKRAEEWSPNPRDNEIGILKMTDDEFYVYLKEVEQIETFHASGAGGLYGCRTVLPSATAWDHGIKVKVEAKSISGAAKKAARFLKSLIRMDARGQ